MHKNNFDFLRLIFALFVLVTHSYALSGKADSDFLAAWTQDQVCFSYIGVRGFFIISGYLIFQSLQRSRDLVDYFWKRVLRLFPALLVVLLLTVMLGPFVYRGSLTEYWSNPEVWSYFPNNASLYRLQHNIKGIFETNPFPKAINGSLWTICYEFTCYLSLAAMIVVRRVGKLSQIILAGLWVGLFVGNLFFMEWVKQYSFFINAGQLIELAIYFTGGSLLAALKFERFRFIWIAVGVAVVAMVVGIAAGQFLNGFHFVFMPIAVIGFGVKSTPFLNDIGKRIGDLSYGIYIYGFPVQQTLVYFLGLDYVGLFFVSVPVTLVLAYGSWHLIEKRALTWKRFRPTAWIERRLGLPNAADAK